MYIDTRNVFTSSVISYGIHIIPKHYYRLLWWRLLADKLLHTPLALQSQFVHIRYSYILRVADGHISLVLVHA